MTTQNGTQNGVLHGSQDDNTWLRRRVAELEQETGHLRHEVQALHADVAMFTQTLDYLRDMVLIKGPHSRIVYANRAFRDHYGMTQAELAGILDAAFNEPDYTQQYIKDDQHVFTTGQVLDIPEEPVTRHDGVVRLFHTVKAPLVDVTGQVVKTVGISQDITERKQLEGDMHQQQALLQDVLNTLPAVIYVRGLDGRMLLVNQQWSAAVGLAVADVIGRHERDLFPPELLRAWNTHTQQVLATEQALAQEETFAQADGLHTYLSARVPLRDAQGTIYAIAGILTDITERKQAEETLQLAQFTLDQASDGIHWVGPDGQQHYVNTALCDLLGYTQDELLTLKVADFDPNFPSDAWEAAWSGVKQQGSSTFETTHQRKDGSLIPVEVTASYLNFHGKEYVCSFIRDITERRRDEAALRTFSALVDNTPGAVGLATIDGEITYANAAFRTLTGYGDALIGMRFYDLYPREELPAVTAAAQHALEESWEGLLTMQRRDGRRVPVRTSSFVMRDADGQPQVFAGIFQDLTEVQQAEQEQAVLQQQIITAQQDALRELSTPLIPLSDNVVVMPIVGTVDSARSQHILETLLAGIAQHQAAVALLDITGVQIVDTQVASALIRAAQAVQLLGAQVILTGIRPDVAQTLVHLGVDLSNIVTRSTLQRGIAYALQRGA